MGKLEFGEAKSFGKVHRTSSVWDSNPVFSYLKAQCPPLLTCHFWAHVTELESCGSFWRLDRIYMLCEMTLLSARKVEPESLFLFLEFKTDRHSSWARGDLGQTNTCLPQKEPSPPHSPPRGYLAHSPLICCLPGLLTHIYRRENPCQIPFQGLSSPDRVRSSFQTWPALICWKTSWVNEYVNEQVNDSMGIYEQSLCQEAI